MDLLEDEPGAPGNLPELTVSELSGAVKRVVEGAFDRVRVRGEIGRVSRPRSGHLYFDLKDDRAVLNAVAWKGVAAGFETEPEEGMEMVAEGRLTTFPGQSRYQLIVDRLAPAGMGALMAQLEKRKAALAAEGLFAAERKRPIPFLPRVVGVVTSPSGAVIRDILHRLAERFPMEVLVWPVAVQGKACAGEVAAAIRGFNALPAGGLPRPDVLIVARGGGSVEDLWGFNEEVVVRAAAASEIPLISAVGHETDVTLIDFAADRRAPTPTAAAEMAAPVRGELLARLAGLEERRARALARMLEERRRRLRDLARALPRPEALIAEARQRLDLRAEGLPRALSALATKKRAGMLAGPAGRFGPQILAARLREANRLVAGLAARLGRAPERMGRGAEERRARLEGLAARLARAGALGPERERRRLAEAGRLLVSLGPEGVLERGYAIISGEAGVVTRAAGVKPGAALTLRFADGEARAVAGGGAAAPKRGRAKGAQGLLDL